MITFGVDNFSQTPVCAEFVSTSMSGNVMSELYSPDCQGSKKLPYLMSVGWFAKISKFTQNLLNFQTKNNHQNIKKLDGVGPVDNRPSTN